MLAKRYLRRGTVKPPFFRKANIHLYSNQANCIIKEIQYGQIALLGGCDLETGIAKRHQDTVLNSINEGVFTVDLKRRITSFNRAAEKITRVRSGEAVGRPCCEVFRANICADDCAARTAARTGRDDRDVPCGARGRSGPIHRQHARGGLRRPGDHVEGPCRGPEAEGRRIRRLIAGYGPRC